MKKLVFALSVIVATLTFYACSVEEVGPGGLETTQGMDFGDPGAGFTGDGEGSGGGPVDPDDDFNDLPTITEPTCADYQETSIYWNTDTYISGVESGHDVVFLQATGGWPTGTTYAWLLTYEDGTTNYYPHSTEVIRMVDASFDNKITEITITARHEDCEGTGTIVADPPFPFQGGYGKVGGHFLDKIKFRYVY